MCIVLIIMFVYKNTRVTLLIKKKKKSYTVKYISFYLLSFVDFLPSIFPRRRRRLIGIGSHRRSLYLRRTRFLTHPLRSSTMNDLLRFGVELLFAVKLFCCGWRTRFIHVLHFTRLSAIKGGIFLGPNSSSPVCAWCMSIPIGAQNTKSLHAGHKAMDE
ncbi:hypothetical protein AKJ16_DCAP11525 [Drosera capensis]